MNKKYIDTSHPFDTTTKAIMQGYSKKIGIYSKRKIEKIYQYPEISIVGEVNLCQKNKDRSFETRDVLSIQGKDFQILPYSPKDNIVGYLLTTEGELIAVIKPRWKNLRQIILILILLILILLGGVLVFQFAQPSTARIKSPFEMDPNATYDGVAATEETHYDRITVPVLNDVGMARNSKKLVLNLKNESGNPNYFKYTIRLEDGTVLYQSGLVAPGQILKTVEINQAFTQPGTYKASMLFESYAIETFAPMNSYQSDFNIIVK